MLTASSGRYASLVGCFRIGVDQPGSPIPGQGALMNLCVHAVLGWKNSVGFLLVVLLCVVDSRSSALAEMPDFRRGASNAGKELASTQFPATDPSIEPIWHIELETGWEASKATGLPMLIFITSEQCAYCDAMKENTLCDPTVRERLFRRFIPIRLRPDANNRVLSRIKVTTFPTTLVAHPRGKVLAHRIGYQPVESFHELLSEVASLNTPSNSPAVGTTSSIR